MKITKNQLKRIIKEELDSLVNESKMIPGGRKMADKVRLNLQSILGDEFTIREPMVFPDGQMSQSGSTVYEMFWTIKVEFAGAKDEKGSYTTRPDAFAVHITRALNEDTKEHQLIIGGEVSKQNRSFPAVMSTMTKGDPSGFWKHLQDELDMLKDAETRVLASPDGEESLDLTEGEPIK